MLTLGSDGALIVSGDTATRVDAVPVEGDVDPTGAGDSFLLAYLHARQAGASAHEAGRARAGSSRRSSPADGGSRRDDVRLLPDRSRGRRGGADGRRPAVAKVEVSLPLVVSAARVGSRMVAVVDRRPPLLLSDDAGLTWRAGRRGLPAGVAVAIDDDDPDTILYASEVAALRVRRRGNLLAQPHARADRDHRGRVLVGWSVVRRAFRRDLIGGLAGGFVRPAAAGSTTCLGEADEAPRRDIAPGGLGGLLTALVPAVGGLLDGGGLQNVLARLEANGLGAQAASWVGTGANEPITGAEARQAVGPDEVARIAGELGVSESEAADGVAEVLPAVVDAITPHGELPPPSR